MRTLLLVVFIVASAAFSQAAPKQFTISGGQKITAEMKGKMPVPATRAAITIEGAGIAISGGKLSYAFAVTTIRKVTRIQVEDVTGEKPEVILTDDAPQFKQRTWYGSGAELEVSKTAFPWLYERGDSMRIFRFTIKAGSDGEEVVIYQPSLIGRATKDMLRKAGILTSSRRLSPAEPVATANGYGCHAACLRTHHASRSRG